MVKKCNRCEIEKPVSEFYVDKRVRKGGYTSYCKPCNMDKQKDDFIRKYGSYEVGVRARWLKHKYDITLEEYDEMLERQEGQCKVCKEIPTKYLTVDHCHETGRIRGLLCRSCNLALGFLQDSPTRIHNLLLYLEGKL